MSNDDKRRRRDGTTAQLSVADLIARREAETQPIPRITDEQTVRFKATANLSGRELHVTELLKREGRAGEEERGGGFSVPKLVAMASGGVVLAGTVAFTASNLLSSPDERPLAEVRYDTRPAARATNTVGKDLAPAAAAQQQAPQAAESTTDTTTPAQTATQKPRATQQPAPTTTTTTEQAPAPEQPPATTTPAPTTTTTPPSSDTAPPPTSSSSSSSTTPSSPSTPDSSTPPPSSTEPSKPGLGLDLGGILAPIGGFDFFAPAE
ncbi:hypothetical protein AB0A74_09135 [Saccharothrix sp. NPDC042600]|uniref:hypothetical protein n=1 Tax=Saccharothrix TaxID=2071 RepID=UPI0033FB72D3|nr:hypothetical protein GCM10017745_13380 [Saccharothrix mutabilis subsp. capreolus]